MGHTAISTERRLPAPPSSALVLGAILLATCPARTGAAATSVVTSHLGRDSLGIYGGRTDLTWWGDESAWGLLQVGLHATRAGANELMGVPAGDRWTSAGGGIGWVHRAGGLESRALAGMDVVTNSRSWRLQLHETFAWASVAGLQLKAGVASGWMDGWLTYGVRSTAGTAAVAYAGGDTWAEGGTIWDFRSGGVQPPTQLAVALPDTRLFTAYGWGQHAWTSWLGLGGSVRWSDADKDLHQPVRSANGVVTYLDYPYPTPHGETALGALAELHYGRAKLKTHWPLFSQGRYRYDNPDPGAPPLYYGAHGMTIAEIRVGIDIPLGQWNLTIDAEALSRPYRPYAWFTGDAWNHFGLLLTVRYATELPRSTPDAIAAAH